MDKRNLLLVILIFIFTIINFNFVPYWLLVYKTGVGTAYVVDQLLPFFVASFCMAFFLRPDKKIKSLLALHWKFLLLIVLAIFFTHGKMLGWYFFGEEPVSNLIPVTNNDISWFVTGVARGWHISIYILSYLLFGTHALPYNIIILLLFTITAILLYVLLYKLFQKKFPAFIGTLFYVTTPAFQDTFYWQMNISGMSLALSAGILSVLLLINFQKTMRYKYIILSLLFFYCCTED